MTANQIADHVAAVLARLSSDTAFVKELNIANGMQFADILDRALRHAAPPVEPVEPEVEPD